jgi:predicted acetyltransferase
MLEIKKSTMFEMESDPKFRPLLAEYGEEVAKTGGLKPCADIDMYYKIERSGSFHVWSARLDNTMIGFISVIVNIFPHYSLLLSSTESYFVGAQYRYTGAGNKLKAVAEDFLEKMDAEGIIITAPKDGPLIKVLANSDEYKEMGKVFFKRFKRAKS